VYLVTRGRHQVVNRFSLLFELCAPRSVGPLAWSAPEVLASMGTCGSGVVATTATDMYQFGGTLHEIMTCGDAPFWWLLKNTPLLYERRCSADPVEIPGTTFRVPGLRGKSTLQAIIVDSQTVTWRVRMAEGSEGGAYRLRELVEILEGCLEEDPVKRWKGNALYVGMVGWASYRKFLCGVSLVSATLLIDGVELCRLEVLQGMLAHEVDEHDLQLYCPGKAGSLI
jgi:hypothetical protein